MNKIYFYRSLATLKNHNKNQTRSVGVCEREREREYKCINNEQRKKKFVQFLPF